MTESPESLLYFVVTRNHGSLIDTMAFLHGTDFFERAVLLLPPELYATHKTSLSAKTREYNSSRDLLEWIGVDRPSLVFLFCGYLLTAQRLLSASQLRRLLRVLEARACPVLTNDPCFGLLASPLRMTSELPGRTYAEKLHRAWVEWLIPHRLRQSYRILKHLLHCYPVSAAPQASAQGLRTVGCFNPRLLASFESDAAPPPGRGNTWSRPMDNPYWLFVLASLDYEIQVNLHGKSAFIDCLVAQLRQANDAGRAGVLIAPEGCLAAVRESASGLPDVTLIGFCDYQRYVSLLLFAEYAFYWNVGSSSSFYRLVNRLPIFYFDRGHVSRWFRSFFDRTVELFYHGHAPTILDQREPLDPDRLQALAQDYRRSAEDIVRRLRQLPAPEVLVARLLNGRPARRTDREVS